ncbi:MAG: GNAT family N-acetyltransferase [Hominenteromicrobium sp.]
MKLILPEWATELLYSAYVADWGEEKIIPAASDPKGRDWAHWLADVVKMRTIVPPHLVPSTLLFLTDDAETKLYGAIDIRHSLNEVLLNFGGHIGYGIVPSERGKGYAKEQLRLALPVAKALGISRVLITCHDWNTASARTIQACGGVFEDKRQDGGEVLCRYWIDIPLKTLETGRLRLRPWTMDDADALFAYAQNPKIGPAAGWKPHESREDSEKAIQHWMSGVEAWAIEEKASGCVIGYISLHNDKTRDNPRTKMLGYALREESWGRDYVPEAVRRMTRFAFEELCMDVVSIGHFAENTQSRRVAEKCGFQHEGVLRHAELNFDGSIHDLWMWSMLRGAYFGGKETTA